GILLGPVADDIQPPRIALVPNLPKLLVESGELLDRLSDEELERLADVLFLDPKLLLAAALDLAKVARRDFIERPVDDLVLVGGGLSHGLWDIDAALGRLEVEQGV